MKKSDAQSRINQLIGPGLRMAQRELLEMMAAAGVAWDSEDEPMADFLTAVFDDPGGPRLIACAHPPRAARLSEMILAAALYNKRPTFERIAQEMTALHDRLIHSSAIHFGETAAEVSEWIDHLRSPIQ